MNSYIHIKRNVTTSSILTFRASVSITMGILRCFGSCCTYLNEKLKWWILVLTGAVSTTVSIYGIILKVDHWGDRPTPMLGTRPPGRWVVAIHNKLEDSSGSPDIPIGQILRSCTVSGTIALTFDDGPSLYTQELLDILKANDAHATFFVIGSSMDSNNNSWSAPNNLSLHRMANEGHQIASHTCSLPSPLPHITGDFRDADPCTAGRIPTSTRSIKDKYCQR